MSEILTHRLQALTLKIDGALDSLETRAGTLEAQFDGLGTASAVNTGTSGEAVPLLSGGNTWGALQTFTANALIGSPAASTTQTLTMQGATGVSRRILWMSGGTARWSLAGSNAADDLVAFAFKDDGTSAGTLFRGVRASGVSGGGAPYFGNMAAGIFNSPRATTPNNASGNYYNWHDTQPTITLAAGPISTTNGSASVVIAWPAHGLNTSTDVLFAGATAVGGITLSGWYRVTATTADTITVTAGSAATSTAAGGGSAVTARASFCTSGDRLDFIASTSAEGFSVGRVTYFRAEPAYYRTTASGLRGPAYEGIFAAALSPSDATQLNSWTLTAVEFNAVNRGADEGYQPDIFSATRAVNGMYMVPEHLVQFAGNEGKNCNAAFVASRNVHANSTNFFVKWYQAFVVPPCSLVSNHAAVAGRGGTGFDVFGAYTTISSGSFATTAGTSVVRVSLASSQGGLLTGKGSPTSIYLPVSTTVSGVTVAAGSHAITVIDDTTFSVVGTGTAAAATTGGAKTWVAFDRDVPYEPIGINGQFSRGIDLTDAYFTNGYALMLGAGQGISLNGTPLTDSTFRGTNTGDQSGANFHIRQPGLFIDTSLTSSSTTIAGSADRVQMHMWVPDQDTTVDQVGVEVTTGLAGANTKVLAYEADSSGAPSALLFETANLDSAAAGYKFEARNYTFLRGKPYWMGVRTSGTQTLRGTAGAGVRTIGRAAATGLSASTLIRTLPFATAAGAWGTFSASQLATSTPAVVIMRLA